MNKYKYDVSYNNDQKVSQSLNYKLSYLNNDIIQLESNFLRLKILLSELNTYKDPQKIMNLAQINNKIKDSNKNIQILIINLQKQIRLMNKYFATIGDHQPSYIKKQKSTYLYTNDQIIDDRLNRFQRCLKQYSQKQQKLIKIVNYLLNKYNKNEDLDLISNDIKLNNKIMMSQVDYMTNSHRVNRMHTQDQSKRINRISKLPIYQAIQVKQRNNSFIKNHKNIMKSQQPLQFRKVNQKINFCQKISLKACGSKQMNSPLANNRNSLQNSIHKQRRSESTQAHDHRFLMMMKKLNQ